MMRSAKWRNPKLWIGIVSSVVVLYLALDSLGRTSPGPLSLAHAELDGPGNCSKCHGGWFEEMTDACLKCHAPIDKQIESGTGLHGTLDSARASQCAVCHSDHHGPSFQMVNAQSFAAVDTTREAFDHNIVGFAMTGKHLELECAECHKNADNVLLLEGETRFLGLDRNCAVCHEDSHEGA
ncbi:MAG: hypothetical protein OER88_05705, partial [Planctomycetota bacterium]|nr:hypothetical protein [Planctomycetota bacterium]